MKIIINEMYSIETNTVENIKAEIEIQDNSNIATAKLNGDRNLLFEIRLNSSNYIEEIKETMNNNLNLDFDYKNVLEII